jgi:uncharacterized protein (DUF2384 family)
VSSHHVDARDCWQRLTAAEERRGVTGYEALKWLEAPAMALDQRRPIDLVETPDGEASVRRLLNRIEYCVYT